jgi:hypothetical protein
MAPSITLHCTIICNIREGNLNLLITPFNYPVTLRCVTSLFSCSKSCSRILIIFCNTFSDSERSWFRSFFFIFKWQLRILSPLAFVSSCNYVAERWVKMCGKPQLKVYHEGKVLISNLRQLKLIYSQVQPWPHLNCKWYPINSQALLSLAQLWHLFHYFL